MQKLFNWLIWGLNREAWCVSEKPCMMGSFFSFFLLARTCCWGLRWAQCATPHDSGSRSVESICSHKGWKVGDVTCYQFTLDVRCCWSCCDCLVSVKYSSSIVAGGVYACRSSLWLCRPPGTACSLVTCLLTYLLPTAAYLCHFNCDIAVTAACLSLKMLRVDFQEI